MTAIDDEETGESPLWSIRGTKLRGRVALRDGCTLGTVQRSARALSVMAQR